MARKGNYQRRILLVTRNALNVVNWVILSSIVQIRKMTKTRNTRNKMIRRRNFSRREEMAKHIMLSGIPMQTPMTMMMMMTTTTSHPREAPSLFSTPYCLMAKGGAKVLQDGALEELTYDDLDDMLNDTDEFMSKEKA
jgi:hypothetical protein